MRREEEIMADIQTKVKEYEQLKKAKEEKKKEKSQYVTKDDLENLLVQLNQGKTDTEIIQPQQMQPQQKPMSNKQQIAFQLWKDSKATSIVCLIAILLPMIAVLITMIPGGVMYALVVSFAGVVYPCIVFVKMIGLQTRLYNKYGLKPLLQFKQQYMPYQQPKQIKSKEGDMML